MQVFLPLPSYRESAKVLDDKRLGKQRVECLQILKALKAGPETNGKKTPWYNHPAVQMFKGFELSLIDYGLAVCEEWTNRGFNDSCRDKILHIFPEAYNQKDGVFPPWFGDHRFHASHRSNLRRKNPEWYGQFGWKEPDNLPYFWPTKELTLAVA